ncbi:hypothetical protein PHLGIDRAFT_211829 [Phlebiopsis gigantea 11061_1 CR5-6]|uniref:Uncharacterized protein n=1 Tax=Phlebiopsis gigantea (strain 11061_1 CR5-6) TaxID=745531 RepID=A0A0C3S6D1_PHLG1|nr:hypothetical protein PHLGIDRAFT_211829 [Phlebiopsis gigantea 11061_1 CR5-6]
MIEEKLEKLGVEKGSGSSVSNIHAPHARAASISSPADPALLFFKLNKLQQSQHASASGSLAPSPQPSTQNDSTPPSNGLPPRLQNRHGQSMSLAQPPSFFNHSAAFNPFGPAATLGSDQILTRSQPGIPTVTATSENAPLHAPQGIIPTNLHALAPPLPRSRPESRPDFARGFGLDVTAEEEEPPEDGTHEEAEDEINDLVGDVTVTPDEDPLGDGASTVAQSRVHSRHVSKLSAALSLRAVGRIAEDAGLSNPSIPAMIPSKEPEGEHEVFDTDAVEEWTGSEDMKETSDDESIGEWSNPSDEERARQDRLHRRMLRRARQVRRDLEAPRRLPNFPRPPDTFLGHSLDDDVISNPSDEEFLGYDRPQQFSRPVSSHSAKGRPLPPLPHSRTNSAHYSYHDPALAHSREASGSFMSGGLFPRPSSNHSTTLASNMPRAESLNPLAKPFVFGSRTPTSSSAPTITPATSGTAHIRVPSLGKPLNVAAPEFVPGGFTFQPPSGIPQLSFPQPDAALVSRPLPTPPVASEPRATQGREKRQRRGSHASYADEESGEEGNNTMSSFKFPPTADDAKVLRHSAPASPPASSNQHNVVAKPFTFSAYGSAMSLSHEHIELPTSLIAHGAAIGGDAGAADTVRPTEPDSATELPFPPTSKPKRAPIPLDFKHPVSSNTVPAGLFKALANADEERTRRSVRSRLSSRDVFEHSPRPSLDDLAVPTISQRQGNRRLFTDPGVWDGPTAEETEVYSPPRRRSAPPRRTSMTESEVSLDSLRRIELKEYEQRLAALLDQKMGLIKKTLEEYRTSAPSQGINASTQSSITEMVSLLRTQLQGTAAKALSDGQVDARGEFDFEMLRDILEQSSAETRNAIQRDLEDLFTSRNPANDFRKFAEDLSERTMKAVITATSQVTMHMHTLDRSRGSFATERENIVRDIVTMLTPHLSAAHTDPVDYDALTAQLSQAVKPHISQLIDLASDKRETASLIVDSLAPMLSSLYPPQQLDADAIVGRLSNEVRKIVAPLDAHEIKEQVSDLVVERLDSRLAVRDRAFSPDAISDKIANSLRGLFSPLNDLQASVDALSQKEAVAPAMAAIDLSGIRAELNTALSELPAQLRGATESLANAQVEFFRAQEDRQSKDSAASEDVQQVLDGIDEVLDEQKRMVAQNTEFSTFCQDILQHINELPEAIVEATKVLQNAHADIISRDTSFKDAEEIRSLISTNSELQVQLAKARGAHGQVRVEKDTLANRLKAMESERDSFRTKLEGESSLVSESVARARAAETKAAELEAALAQALERIKSSDIAAQASQERISSLEKTTGELTLEKQQLKLQVDRFETSAPFVAREKELLTEEIRSLRKQNEDLIGQQSNWEELRQTSEQLQNLATLFSRQSDEESQELKRTRDRFRTLESDHAALQRRFRDQETKATNSEKTAFAARQSLSQAQQRASEWEKRAKDSEQELESTRTRVSEIEQAHSQLDADFSVLKLQVEERDADERLAKDRESKLRDQIASLEAQLARSRAEADQAKAAVSVKPTNGITSHSLVSSRIRQNGYTHLSHTPSRPDSRASTIYNDSRAATPSAQPNYGTNTRTASPQQPSVWNSIHAPTARRDDPARLPVTPKAVRPHQYYRAQIPSPTPSNVSAAPTLGNDGWWQ